MKYYKFLTKDNQGPYSNFDFTPYLPTDDQPGPWLPVVERLELCASGYHACTREQLLRWLDDQMWEVEYRDDPEQGQDKVNGTCIRFVRRVDTWNDQTARMFAVWCAREALELVDEPDPRSIESCNVAERYANGEATQDELDAARDAAWAAARAWTMTAASVAAMWAARPAAMSAAVAAALVAAWPTARYAQNKKLIEMLELP